MSIQLRAQDRDSLARFLGWFSIGLGTAQVTAPRVLCKIVGADGEGLSKRVMRAMGARELAHGVAILTRPRPTLGVASRVAGDALDLALLGLTAARHPDRIGRTAFAAANVLAVTVPDVLETIHLSKKTGPPQSGKLIRKAVTINRPRQEVEAAWLAAEEIRQKVEEAGASVRFADAPGDRGTELIVEFVFDPPGGDFGVAAAKLTGKDLATQLSDDLRRLKQELEAGEVVRSDGTPAGHDLANHLKQRAAQPLKEAVR
jgi:uncharacterized membrane protein